MREGCGGDMASHGLYVHVPFCRSKCRYCDFCSRPQRGGEIEGFVAALIHEIELALKGVRLCAQANTSPRLGTVYFGGGTPSMMGADRLAAILDAIRGWFDVAADAEVTVEANPLDVTPEWAAACLAAGFNRISIGVQSVVEDDLRFLGRAHHAPDGPRAVEVARDAGFAEIGIDLITGLPKQTPPMLRERVALAVESCRPTHVSCYQLTWHEGTPLWDELQAGRWRPLSEDEEYELFVALHGALAHLGYPAYEVSNFSLDGRHRSRHNANYWRHVPYVGLGPSAHSFDGRARWWNVSSVEEYLARLEAGKSPVDGREELSDEQLASEAVMLALRTTDGLDLGAFRGRFGRDLLREKPEAIAAATARGLIAPLESHLRPTVDGLAVADRLAAELA